MGPRRPWVLRSKYCEVKHLDQKCSQTCLACRSTYVTEPHQKPEPLKYYSISGQLQQCAYPTSSQGGHPHGTCSHLLHFQSATVRSSVYIGFSTRGLLYSSLTHWLFVREGAGEKQNSGLCHCTGHTRDSSTHSLTHTPTHYPSLTHRHMKSKVLRPNSWEQCQHSGI